MRFAIDRDGRMPARDYLENEDKETDPNHQITHENLRRFVGYFKTTATDGHAQLNPNQFKPFIGEDGKDGMAEYRVGSKQGHRMLCFRTHDLADDGRRIPTIVLACGFRKPNQYPTPPAAKERARQILAADRDRSNRRAKDREERWKS